MPLAVLLNPDDPLFAFEHDQQTRALVAATGLLTSFVLDPTYDTNQPATKWHQDHQASHSTLLPLLGIPPNEILIDSDLANTSDRTWWTFANHQEHFYANLAL